MAMIEGKKVGQYKLNKDQRRAIKFLVLGQKSEEEIMARLTEFIFPKNIPMKSK